jgi:hypothetical protein
VTEPVEPGRTPAGPIEEGADAAVDGAVATAETGATEEAGEPAGAAGTATLRSRGADLVRWAVYVVASWVYLRPILITTIVADDFVNPFNQFTQSGTSVLELVRDGWNGARLAGHINFAGQIIGGFVNTLSNVLMAEAGLRYSTIYAGLKLVALILAATAGAGFLWRAAAAMGRPIGVWRARVSVSVLLFATLQLHIAWSNDPVGSYPASGYASAAVGFLVLSLALDALRFDDARRAAIAGAVGALSVWYYEINVAAVFAVAPMLVWWWFVRDANGARRWSRLGVHTALLVAAPVAAVLASKILMAPAAGTYTGTQVAVSSGIVSSVGQGLVSTLPASAWTLSREWLHAPVSIWATPVVVMLVAAVGIVLAARRWPMPPGTPSRLAGALFGASAIAYMVGATTVQSATQKVQDETPRIGYVYNYYAIGSTALAVVVALAVLLAPRALNRSAVRVIASSVLITVAAVQLLVNWNITVKFNAATAPNRHLLVTYSEGRAVEERCQALWDWSAGGWPDYYELYMIDGLQDSYQYFHGEPFCPGFVRPP